jgi:hypothetical protein
MVHSFLSSKQPKSLMIFYPMYMSEREVNRTTLNSSRTGSTQLFDKLVLAKGTPLKGGKSCIVRLFLDDWEKVD